MNRIIASILPTAIIALAGVLQAQEPAKSVLDLMKSVVIPQSDAVFAVGKAVPGNDGEWAALEHSAAQLMQAAKTLAAQRPASAGADWLKFSQGMGDVAAAARAAAKSKNPDAVLDAGDALYETCVGCHKQYLKK